MAASPTPTNTQRIIEEGLDRARSILETRKDALVAVSKALMKQEVIDSEELSRIIEENSPSALLVPGTEAGAKRPLKPASDEAIPEPESAEG